MRFIWKPTGFEAVQWTGVVTPEIIDFLEIRGDILGAVTNPPRIGSVVMYFYDGTKKFDKLWMWEERSRRYVMVVPGDWIIREMSPYGFYRVDHSWLMDMAEPFP